MITYADKVPEATYFGIIRIANSINRNASSSVLKMRRKNSSTKKYDRKFILVKIKSVNHTPIRSQVNKEKKIEPPGIYMTPNAKPACTQF